MHHSPSISIVEIIRCLVESLVIVWRTMVMYEEYPSDTLVSEFRGQVHVDRPQRCHSDGITPSLRVPSSRPSVSLRFRDLHGPVIALPCGQGVAQQFLNFLPLPQGQ